MSLGQDGLTAGDVVLHPNRKEWGEGVVEKAIIVRHQGQAGQRVIVRFANKGRVTLHTAVIALIPKETVNQMSSTTTNSQGWLASLEQKTGTESELHALPDALTDPFLSNARRLEATLDTYRYARDNPRDILEWAIGQTGLTDPLSKYTRHELEQGFDHFARDRDLHLLDTVKQLKFSSEEHLLQIALRNHRIKAARTALQKAMSR